MIVRGASKSNKPDHALRYYTYFTQKYSPTLSCNITLNSMLECLLRNDMLKEAVEIFDGHLK